MKNLVSLLATQLAKVFTINRHGLSTGVDRVIMIFSGGGGGNRQGTYNSMVNKLENFYYFAYKSILESIHYTIEDL